MYFILSEYYDLFTNIGNIFLHLYITTQTTDKAVFKSTLVVLDLLNFSNN